ncbi:GIY-YIG nuclease family protein [Paracoccus benzoatiresistens]|uniref:GIY-YIG nuclease family protein n=1 Tax=Paracoccus benzoatiresistens TaxID=2997341 RepID=A0ABT4J5U1_9RHOB|nr:GIY-YIG nuclease family protein [Paracoccus sp. EF6]MCZ0962462.1 GIY-YIG nuclease family protein [Paracoccus sp. EF6]
MTTHPLSPVTPGSLSLPMAIPFRHRTFPPDDMPTRYAGPVHGHWWARAEEIGFTISGRVRDRYHLALRCETCGHVHASRIYTLMAATPQCPACLVARLEADAEAAGLMHLDRDPDHRHYSWYGAACGHALRRQHEIVRRVARGETELRCETCHAATEAAEAAARGWTLVGSDPQGNPSYRLYAHESGCGGEQRIARANMRTGRFDCATCGCGWAASPSYLYAMKFTLACGREVVKAGYSRDPLSRLIHQLRIDRAMPCRILSMVPIDTGHEAIRLEKSLHARLRRTHPDAIVDPDLYRGQIRVRSEIYDAKLTLLILTLLSDLDRDAPED